MEEPAQYRKEARASLNLLQQQVQWKPGKAAAHLKKRKDIAMKRQDALLKSFCQGVRSPQVSGFEVLELLDLRSVLTRYEGKLTEKERKKLEDADTIFRKNTRLFYQSISQIADLEELFKKGSVSPSHWWYLEKLVQAEQVAAYA